jgi:hypothetical protein
VCAERYPEPLLVSSVWVKEFAKAAVTWLWKVNGTGSSHVACSSHVRDMRTELA